MKEQDKKFEECLKIINELKNENINLKKEIKVLEERPAANEQYSRINSVEIFGIPEKSNENVLETVKSLEVFLI